MKYRWLKWSDDSWLSRQGTILPYDKAEHATVSAILALIATLFMPPLIACLAVFIVGLLWEVKDGYLRWEIYGWWGGEGFSWKDLIADSVGIAVGIGLAWRF